MFLHDSVGINVEGAVERLVCGTHMLSERKQAGGNRDTSSSYPPHGTTVIDDNGEAIHEMGSFVAKLYSEELCDNHEDPFRKTTNHEPIISCVSKVLRIQY